MLKNVLSIVQQATERWPDNQALWVKGDSFTYRELWALASQCSVAIQRHLPSDFSTHIAIYAHKSLPAYVGVWTSILSGLNYLPLNPRFPAERNARMIQTTNARIWIVDNRCIDEAKALLQEMKESILVLLPEMPSLENWCQALPQHQFLSKSEISALSSNDWQEPSISPQDGLYTLFTSGSTGVPKGVLVTHHNVASYLDNVQKFVTVLPEDRCTQIFDLTFDVSVHDMFVCWKSGAGLYVVPENAALFAGRFVQEHELTHWFSVPSTAILIKQMEMLEPGAFPTLKYGLFAGEALQCSLAGSFQEAAPNAKIVNLYGPTEATITFTGYEWTECDQAGHWEGGVPIGIPLPTQRVAIVNELLEPVSTGEIGELFLGGSQVTPGYYKAEILTQERFIPLPKNGTGDMVFYKTGDLVSWHEGIGLKFHGRADRQVKIRGFRVELQEIENALQKIMDTEHVAVIGTPVESKDGFKGLVAYTTKKDFVSQSIIELSRNKLPDYMVPDAIQWLKELPLNSNGKIDYKALNSIYTDASLAMH